MDNRLAKRHKRQVSRAKERGKVSEPDIHTPEELTAVREASSAVGGRRNDHRPSYETPAANRAGAAAGGAAHAAVGP
jgi:hypothetical protein